LTNGSAEVISESDGGGSLEAENAGNPSDLRKSAFQVEPIQLAENIRVRSPLSFKQQEPQQSGAAMGILFLETIDASERENHPIHKAWSGEKDPEYNSSLNLLAVSIVADEGAIRFIMVIVVLFFARHEAIYDKEQDHNANGNPDTFNVDIRVVPIFGDHPRKGKQEEDADD
jgi:hypothetical protein